MKSYDIDIFRLSNKLHQFKFRIDRTFFESREQELVENGDVKVQIEMDKNDRFISLDFHLSGTVELVCDRSLDQFNYPIEEQQKVIFKYGDQETELSEDMVMITAQTQQINVAQYIFEFIGLALPMKKLHPRYQDDNEGSVVYSSQDSTGEPQATEADPRWNELKRLKKD